MDKTYSLRGRLIRLAHANPSLRPHILPLLKQSAEESDSEGKFEKGEDVPLSEMPDELEENAKNPPPSVKKLKEKMKAKK